LTNKTNKLHYQEGRIHHQMFEFEEFSYSYIDRNKLEKNKQTNIRLLKTNQNLPYGSTIAAIFSRFGWSTN